MKFQNFKPKIIHIIFLDLPFTGRYFIGALNPAKILLLYILYFFWIPPHLRLLNCMSIRDVPYLREES